MIIYVKKLEYKKLVYNIFCTFKIEKDKDDVIFYIQINNKSHKRKIEKVCERLGKYFYKNNIKNVVLEEELMSNQILKNELYSYNINILDGTMLSKFLVYNVLKKVYQYKNARTEAGEVTILVNENDDINIQTITMIAKEIKRLNIISKDIRKFRKIADYIYNELGILIKLSNNLKTNLKGTDVIVNIDFPEELINQLNIPSNVIIINLPRNINIKSKKFSGINIKSWELDIPNKYKKDRFNEEIIYEANIHKKTPITIFEQIQNDNLKIKNLLGLNGVINPDEFKKIT